VSQAIPTVAAVNDGAWNPWTEAGQDRDLTIDFFDGRIPAGLYSPVYDAIVIRHGLTRTRRRSVLAHELGHRALGHHPTTDLTETARMQQRADRWAAVRLITLPQLADALRGASSWFEVADTLDVDPDLLQVRVRGLTDDELDELRRMVGEGAL